MSKVFKIYLVFMLFLFGCAPRIYVTPDIEEMECKNFQVRGKIDYNGNKEYLPRVITNEAGCPSDITFRYTHDTGGYVTSSSKRVFDPISGGLLGYLLFPRTFFEYTINGELEIMKGEKIIKTYKATASSSRQDSNFSQKQLSEMNERALIEIRNNIEAQICHDKDFLLQNLMQ